MIFPAFCGCESILGRESTDVIFCFHFLSSPFILHSFPLMFLSFCIHFLSFCFHVLSFSIAMYQRYRSSKGVYPPKRSRFFHTSLSFLLSFSIFFGGLCRLPSSGFMNMYMYKLVIVFFTLIVFWTGTANQTTNGSVDDWFQKTSGN